jgi:glycosyltransferase involved in cell wall biosynthesis
MKEIALEVSGIINNHQTGISRYTKNLIDGFLNLKGEVFSFDLLYKYQYKKKQHLCYNPDGITAYWHYKCFYHPLKTYQIIHSTDSVPIIWGKAKKIYTIHDLAVLQPHLQFKGFSKKSYTEATKRKYEFISKHADAIICVSRNTKHDFCNMFSFDEDKAHVIHLGFEKRNFPNLDTYTTISTLNLKDKAYLLYVGLLSIRKNIINIIKAYCESIYFKALPLVLAGGFSTGYQTILKYIEENNLRPWIILTDYASDELIHALYSHAKAFIFPTYYEGFGIPILEAYSYGLPVITSNTGSAPEIAGGFAQLCNPQSIEEIKNAINNIENTQEHKIRAARNYALQFTWQKCCNETINVYMKYW